MFVKQVYTSGKGSSAAGLTASVMRDPISVSDVNNGDRRPSVFAIVA